MKIKQLIIYCILICILSFLGCTKDFEEINSNSLGITSSTDGALFNAIFQSLIPSGNEQFYLWNEIFYPETQLAALTTQGWGNYSIGTEAAWSDYYKILPNFRELQRRIDQYKKDSPTDEGIQNMQAILDILLAVKTFKLTDYFGDIPYSEAGYGFQSEELLYPKYDTQESIYHDLLNRLKSADANLSTSTELKEPFKTFIQFDQLFKGNLLKWQKFANSLSLRYATRMYNKDAAYAGALIKDIVQNERPLIVGYQFINPVLETVCIWPNLLNFKNDALNWSFREHKNLRMGSNIWRYFSENNAPDGSGIFDLRAYIFFEPNNKNQWVPYPQLPDINTPQEGGIPYGTQRDLDGGFEIKGTANLFSPFNYFIIRDDSNMPIILFTGAETHFILSEIYLRGMGVPVDESKASEHFLNGVNSSLAWWQNLTKSMELPNSHIKFSDKVSIPENLSSINIQNKYGFWNFPQTEDKLKVIYLQRWIDAFRQPAEAYALTRQTGQTPHEGNRLTRYRLPYPPSEDSYNTLNKNAAAARQGGDGFEQKIWWCTQ